MALRARISCRMIRSDCPFQFPEIKTDDTLDIYSANTEGIFLPRMKTAAIPTNLTLHMPLRCVGLILSIDALALEQQLVVANAPGIVPPTPQEVMVLLHNQSPTTERVIEPGMLIARVLVLRAEEIHCGWINQ